MPIFVILEVFLELLASFKQTGRNICDDNVVEECLVNESF